MVILATRHQIETAIARGHRCPFNKPAGPIDSRAVRALCRSGDVELLISGRNYRVVRMLTGKYAGRTTKPDPGGHPAWRICGARGPRSLSARAHDTNTLFLPPEVEDRFWAHGLRDMRS